VLKYLRGQKRDKLVQFAERVWQIAEGDDDAKAEAAIARTEAFFRSLGAGTRLGDYGIPAEAIPLIAERLAGRTMPVSEQLELGPRDVEAILALAVEQAS
jgi:NADP-dependent alcohol dehydrogenase